MRPQWKFVWSFLALLCTRMPAPAWAQAAACDEHVIDPASYTLMIRAQAGIVTEERRDWWDSFDVTTIGDSSGRERALVAADPGHAGQVVNPAGPASSSRRLRAAPAGKARFAAALSYTSLREGL